MSGQGSGNRHPPLAGFFTTNGQMPEKQWFGPSSLFYFVGRITSHLAAFLDHPPAEHTINFGAANKVFANDSESSLDAAARPTHAGQPLTGLCGQQPAPGVESCHAAAPSHSLTAMEEEYFLNLFWQSYHCTFQIIDEAKFRAHYKSLWTGPGHAGTGTRKHSALVDIILALCMLSEYPPPPPNHTTTTTTNNNPFPPDPGPSSNPETSPTNTNTNTNTNTMIAVAVAGRFHYQRCQTLLLAQLETPSLTTVQCHLFSAIYLCCGSFQNMAHSTLALAVRTAHILGLHLEQPPNTDLPRAERELRKRIWWTLYALESRTCLKLGRPWSVPLEECSCPLPDDDYQLAMDASGSAVVVGGGVTWLSYTVWNTRLVLGVTEVYGGFYRECGRVGDGGGDIHDDPVVLERCAVYLQSRMAETLDVWARTVPEGLRSKRQRDNNHPFSTDSCLHPEGITLTLEPFAPRWLQLQRLVLELLYHNLCVILYRPLISFSTPTPTPTSTPPQQTNPNPHHAPVTPTPTPTPRARECALLCARHAITLTQITHQILLPRNNSNNNSNNNKMDDLLERWNEAFQWQWNCAITLIGFVLAYPHAPRSSGSSFEPSVAAAARTAIGQAVESFEVFGRHFAVATRAARVVRDLMGKVEAVVDHHLHGDGSGGGVGGRKYEDGLVQVAGANANQGGMHVIVDGAGGEGGLVWQAGASDAVPVMFGSGSMSGFEGAGLQDLLNGTMDAAFSVDSFNSFEWLRGGSPGFGDSWMYTPRY
jgi:hypothetical protein